LKVNPKTDTGRVRRWAAALVPPALLVATPSAVAFAFHSRIAGQMGIGAVGAAVVLGAAVGGLAVVMMAWYQRSPALQRQTAVGIASISGLLGAQITLHVVSLIDAPAPDDIRWFGMDGASAWFWGAALPVALAFGALAWAVARVDPPSAATAAPRADAPMLTLAPRQKAMFTAALWMRSNLWAGLVLLASGTALIVVSAVQGNSLLFGVLMGALGLWTVAQSRARLHIDERGISFATAGTWASTTAYEHVLQAEVLAASPRPSHFPPGGGVRGWGASTGSGPALHLQLTNGRAFVFSTAEAGTAAALINAYLHRERSHVDHG
jgi:MFS family permease